MPHSKCIICTKRIQSNERKRRIGAPNIWSKIGKLDRAWEVEPRRDDTICGNCNMKLTFGRTMNLPTSNIHTEADPAPQNNPNSGVASQEFDLVSSIPMSQYDQQLTPMFDEVSSIPMSVYCSQTSQSLDFNLSFHSTMNNCDRQVPDQLENGTMDTENSLYDSSRVSSSCCSQSQPHSHSTSTHRYPGIKSVKATESYCFLCGKKAGRQRIPRTAVIDVWVKMQIRIPFANRTCKEHLQCLRFTTEALDLIEPRTDYSMMTEQEVVEWMQLLGEEVKRRKLPFDFSGHDVTDEEHKVLVGLSKKDFKALLSFCVDMRNTDQRTISNALAMLLMKMRLNLSQTVLALLFNMKTQRDVSRCIKSVIKSLSAHFVPLHLGYEHMTREDVLSSHSVPAFNKLLMKPEAMILILDGTYFYIQKPSDHEKQRQTYNLHKHRNLLKAMMVVTTTGRMVECEGLYYSDAYHNDSQILEHMLRKPSPNILDFFEAGDCALLDRGFRDVISLLQECDLDPAAPKNLPKSAKQFSDLEGNASRQVTSARWIVEAANAKLKSKFHFFDGVIPASMIPKVKPMLRIACAIINAFSPPIFTPSEAHDELMDLALKRLEVPNELKEELESTGLINKRVVWKEATTTSVPHFPKLSLELKRITLGSYQLRMGALYAEQHVKNDASSTFKIFIHREQDNLVRASIQARFSKSTQHYVWIRFTPNGTGAESIREWYCKCKTGARTLGCCSHIAGVVWYMAWARFNLDKLPKRRNISSSILNVAAALVEDAGDEGDEEEEEDEDLDLEFEELDSLPVYL